MLLNWIDAKQYTMKSFLLLDRWILRLIMTDLMEYDLGSRDYLTDMAKAMYNYPYVLDYCEQKAPECAPFISRIRRIPAGHYSQAELRDAETSILQALEVFIVYAYPEVMDNLNYIRNWSEDRLYELVDLDGKIVLDVGSGTGRLAFAAAKKARRVYASEPCSRLREYMKEKIARNHIRNIKVVDGEVLSLPYEDNTFDVVLAGHVVGDFFHAEIAELSRVLKDGGWIVCCSGDDEFKRTGPSRKFVSGGFEYFCHESAEGGIIYDYRLQIQKKRALPL